MAKYPYSNSKAIAYAKAWANKKANSCGTYYSAAKQTDCAHFIAHCLNAGGINVPSNVPDSPTFKNCSAKLAVRNTSIEAMLRILSQDYENIFEIDLSDAIVGDIGFLQAHRPVHAFMVCEVWNKYKNPLGTPKVWAHSTERNCEEMDTDFKQWFSSAYRLEDYSGP